MFAVVAPGMKGIYHNSRDIDAILRIYPYARFKKCQTEDECYAWISENESRRKLEELRDYGTASRLRHVVMSYYLDDSNLYLNYDTKNFGQMRIALPDDPAIEKMQAPTICSVKMPFGVYAKPLQRSLLGLVTGLELVGDMIDIVVKAPDHSVYYALRSYTGKDTIICRAQDAVRNRQGGTSVSLKEVLYESQPQA